MTGSGRKHTLACFLAISALDIALKTYQTPDAVLAEIEAILAGPTVPHESPLDRVVSVISYGRHCPWVGIYLTTTTNGTHPLVSAGGEVHPGQIVAATAQSKVLVSIKLGSHEFGILGVETDRQHGFGMEDRVLLERVATMLARFLGGRGKYLVRKARAAGRMS